MLRRPPSLLTHFVALTLSAVLLALSYPLPGWGFLAWVALVPAGWLAATSRKPWRLVWTASLVFVMWWVWMLRWLWPVTLPGALATAGFQSLFWVVALLATNVCVRRQRVPVAVALPLCWVSLEYVRCIWPWGGFAWFTLAQTQAAWRLDESALWVGSASVAGAWGVSVTVSCINGLGVAGIQLWAKPRPAEVSLLLALGAAACLAMFLVLPTAFSLGPSAGSGWSLVKLPITVVQTNAPHSNKLAPTVAIYEDDFATLSRLHAEAAVDEPALIVWPETTVPGKFNEPTATLWERWADSLPDDAEGDRLRTMTSMPRRAKGLITQHGVPTLVGGSTFIETADPENPTEYNSAYLVDTGGSVGGRYDKMHRVPFGEYIPLPEGLKQWVLSTLSPYDFDYSIDAGEEPVVFEVASSSAGVANALRDQAIDPDGLDVAASSFRFATPICFEDTNAALCRRMVHDPDTGQKRVDALINLTTNGWFGHLPSDEYPNGGMAWRSMRYQHLQLASLRAIENRVPMVRSVNTGVSAVIDSTGRIVAAAAPGEATVLRAELVLDDGRTLYAIVGDWPIRVLAGLTLLLVLWARLRTPAVQRSRIKRKALPGLAAEPTGT